MAGKLFYFPFYPDDWLSDEKLRLCSLAARGLWIDLLALMHKGDRRGFLQQANGTPFTLEQIARLTGCSSEEAGNLLQELSTSGVTSATENGVIYNRRMVRDEKKRQQCSEAGKKGGGNPTFGKSFKRQSKGDCKGANKGDGKRPLSVECDSDSEKQPDAKEGVGVQGAGEPKRKRTVRDDLFDAIVEVTHAIPKRSGSRIGELVSQFLSMNPPYTPDEVRRFPAAVAARSLSMPITLNSLGDHIGMVRQALPNAGGGRGAGGPRGAGCVEAPPGKYDGVAKKIRLSEPAAVGADSPLFPAPSEGAGSDLPGVAF